MYRLSAVNSFMVERIYFAKIEQIIRIGISSPMYLFSIFIYSVNLLSTLYLMIKRFVNEIGNCTVN